MIATFRKDISMTMQNIRILSNETAKLNQTLGNSFDKLESNDNTLGILLNDTAMLL